MKQRHRRRRGVEGWLGIRPFADRMGVTVWTARAWIRKGRISSCKPGGKILIPATEIDRLFAEGMRPRSAGVAA